MLDHPRRKSEWHRLCPQGCNVEPEQWAGTTLGIAYRAPLCLSSCIGQLSAPVLKLAVKIQVRKQATVLETKECSSSTWDKHLGRSLYALATYSSPLPAFFDVCWASVSSMWRLIYHKVLCEINVPDSAHSFESPARRL